MGYLFNSDIQIKTLYHFGFRYQNVQVKINNGHFKHFMIYYLHISDYVM